MALHRTGLLASIVFLAACSGSSDDGGTPAPGDGGGADTQLAETTPPEDTATPGDTNAGDIAVGDASDAETAPMGRDFSTDRTKFFGASRCAAAGVQLCEDFESGSIDKSIWSVVGTAPVVDGVQKARGSKALHITQNGNGASYIKTGKPFPEMPNAYWGRMFVYFDKLPASPMTYAHWTFAAATGTGVSGEIRLSGQLSGGKNLFGVGTDNRTDPMGTGDWTNSDNDPAGMPKPVPTKEWLCIEWLHDGKNNVTKFYWDATEHKSLETTETMHGGNSNPYILPNFTNVWVGWQEYQTSTETFELWVDEVAFDKERIGCVL